MQVQLRTPRRRFSVAVSGLALGVWVVGSCNTYTPELLGSEAIEVDDDLGPASDDDDVPSDPMPSVVVSPSPDECPVPPCEDEPSDDDVPADDDTEPSVAPSIPTDPTGPTATMGPEPAPTSSGGNGGGPVAPSPTGGGGTGAGGTAAAGGTPEPSPEPTPDGGTPPVVVPPTLAFELIENFEDGNVTLLRNGDRTGYWFADGDPTGDPAGTITPFDAAPVEPPNPMLASSTRALHIVASGYGPTGWAVAGVELENGDPYPPAGDYAGITFWGKAGGSEEAVFAFRIPTVSTEADGVDDHYGGNLTLTDEWALYLIPFDGFLAQQGFGTEVDFVPAEMIGIQFSLAPGETGFDIWIDDITFSE